MGSISGVGAALDVAEIPVMATALNVSSGNVANAIASAAIPAKAGQAAYVTGFQITASGATAAAVVNATLAGVAGGTMTFTFVFPAGVGVGALPLIVSFSPAVAASGPNTALTLSLPAGGAGNTNAAVNVQGFYL